jgi:tetratricopeptide (TPR) repeat protein
MNPCPRATMEPQMSKYRVLPWCVLLLGWMLPSRLAAAKPAAPPTPAPFAVELLPRPGDDPAAPQLVRVSKLAEIHGFVRGSLLLLHSLQGRRSQPVGYAMVVRAQPREVEAVVQVLPKDAQAFPLSAGPMPEKAPLGKSLGVVLSQRPQPVSVAKDDEDSERVLLNLGAGDGVQIGDYFHALGDAVSDADASGRSLGRTAVGLVKVLAVDTLTATAGIEQGTAPAGAFVRFFGKNPPGVGTGKKHEVTLLILRFSGEHGERFSDRLVDALQTQVLRGYKQIHIRHETTPVKDLDGSQTQIRQLGRRHGADVVVWGSVLCSDKRACIRPRVTMVSPDSKASLGLLREEPERDIAHEELGRSALDQEKRVLGLASRLAGLALYQEDNYADAAWHLDRARQGSEEDAKAVRPLLLLCYERIGYWTAALQVAQEVRDLGQAQHDTEGQALGHYWLARMQQQRGEPQEALSEAQKAERLYRSQGEAGRARLALTMAQIADIYEARGQLDEALRIRREEELPVYERLGDIRERAVAQQKIAGILQQRGQLDEALKLIRDEALPVVRRIGAIADIAVFQGRIADIYEARGQLDEALRIRREEELPVYEKLGDIRSRAMTMGKIADILKARGQLDEALRIRREEELPVYEKLGDIRSRAVILGKIANIYDARGQFDEALRIRREEALPVYEKLGDIRERAVTLGKIAGIYQARGQLDEALRIRREETLPVYEKLGDIRSRAVTLGKIADIYQARGQLDEALRIRREEALPVYEKLGDIRSRAVTLGQIADIYEARGQLDEALRIRREEALPVYEKLGDIRERAVAMGQIADILKARGQLDEALRIRREEELPVLEKLKARRDILVCEANIAIALLARKKDGDRTEAERLLRKAHGEAAEMRLPEAKVLEGLIAKLSPSPTSPARPPTDAKP